MIMAQKKLHNFLRKNWWISILLILSLGGIILSCWGLTTQKHNFSDSLYETFRLFHLHHPFDEYMSQWQLEYARWLILAAFLWATFRLFFEIIAPKFLAEQLIKLLYHNHIIICGLNEITISLIKKFDDLKIIVLAKETNKYAENLKTKGKKSPIGLLIGDFTDENFLKKAKICKASQIYIVTDNDQQNVEIAQTFFSVLEKKKLTKAIKCFTLIKDRELKNILEETVLFKHKTNNFDGTLFNMNEIGIKYGTAMNIDKILPEKIDVPPEILLVGLTEKTEIALLNLAHCLTMKHEKFKFTIVEENIKTRDLFQKKYDYLWKFADMEFADEIETTCAKKIFNSILICSENSIETIKRAISIRYDMAKNEPNIIAFCDNSDIFSNVLEKEGIDIFTLSDRYIYLVDLFDWTAQYCFNLGEHIEDEAKETHKKWEETLKKQGKDQSNSYDNFSIHFRQSNINQVLDTFLKMAVALKSDFDEKKSKDKETLAIMEHNRWMIEKYANGWKYGVERKNIFKIHNCLLMWNELPDEEKEKDINAVKLMLEKLNKKETK